MAEENFEFPKEEKEQEYFDRDSDFIELYKSTILDRMPVQESWAEDIACGVLSSVLGRKRRVITKMGNLRLNVWFIFIGPSGLAFKTLPIAKIGRKTLRKAERLSEDGREFLLPTQFTMEGMVEHFDQENDEGIIIRDEVTSLFREIAGGKNYSADVGEFLSELYDGQVLKRRTRKAGIENPEKCYVSFLGATTPNIYEHLRRQNFVQGLGNRILWDIWEHQDGRFPFDSPDEFFLPESKEHEKDLVHYADGLLKLSDSKFEKIIPNNKAAEKLYRFYIKSRERAESVYKDDTSSLKPSYLTRMGTICIKLAALKCVSKDWLKIPEIEQESLNLKVEDFDWAFSKIKHHIDKFNKFLTDWETKPKEPRRTSREREKKAFVEAVKGTEDGIISQKELTDQLGWYNNQRYQELRHTLREEGKIKLIKYDQAIQLPDDVRESHGLDDMRGGCPITFCTPEIWKKYDLEEENTDEE